MIITIIMIIIIIIIIIMKRSVRLIHTIGVRLLSQSAFDKSTIKRKKAHILLHTPCFSQKICLPCLIIIQSCYFDYRINKPFACSRCDHDHVMFDNHTISFFFTIESTILSHAWSAFRLLFTWSRRTTRAKDHRLFYFNYPQINEVGKSDHMNSIWRRWRPHSFLLSSTFL